MISRVDYFQSNLKSLYGIEKALSDTCFRERLDQVDRKDIRRFYHQLLRLLQRGTGLEGFRSDLCRVQKNPL